MARPSSALVGCFKSPGRSLPPSLEGVSPMSAGSDHADHDAVFGRRRHDRPGLDQAMQHPGSPTLHEPSVRDARRYVALAEAAHGPIPVPVTPPYLWGDALAVLEERHPAARIINLETSITTSSDWCRAKDIHYKMHPANIACLKIPGVQVTALANNHTLDWGRRGLAETLATLQRAGMQTAGAGRNLADASRPAVFPLDPRRLRRPDRRLRGDRRPWQVSQRPWGHVFPDARSRHGPARGLGHGADADATTPVVPRRFGWRELAP